MPLTKAKPQLLMAPATQAKSGAAARTYTISELAKEFDITPRAIRFYEDQGLLAPQRVGPNGRNRVYSQRDRTRLKLTLRGKRLAFTLAEIKELVDMYESERDTVPQLKRFLAVLQQHRSALVQQREDIEVSLAEIETFESHCRQLLAQTGEEGAVKAKSTKTVASDESEGQVVPKKTKSHTAA